MIDNTTDIFSPDVETSFLKGGRWYNYEAEILLDGESIFSGQIKDISLDHENKKARFVIENALTKPSETVVVDTQDGINPAVAMLRILELGGLLPFVNEGSFISAGGPAFRAGAVIDYTFLAEDGVSVLDAINTISDLSSISVSSTKGIIRAQAFRPYPGDDAEMRADIIPDNVRQYQDMDFDNESFFNRLDFTFGADVTITITDEISVDKNNGFRDGPAVDASNGNQVVVPNETSARFFGNTKVERSKIRRRVLSVVLDPEFKEIKIGDRHTVTAPRYGLTRVPFEVIETHRQLTENSITARAVSLVE